MKRNSSCQLYQSGEHSITRSLMLTMATSQHLLDFGSQRKWLRGHTVTI